MNEEVKELDPIKQEIERTNKEEYDKFMVDYFKSQPRKIKRKILGKKNSFSERFKKAVKS